MTPLPPTPAPAAVVRQDRPPATPLAAGQYRLEPEFRFGHAYRIVRLEAEQDGRWSVVRCLSGRTTKIASQRLARWDLLTADAATTALRDCIRGERSVPPDFHEAALARFTAALGWVQRQTGSDEK